MSAILILSLNLRELRREKRKKIHETHESLGCLSDGIAESTEDTIRESKGVIGVRFKGLLVDASKCDVGHGVFSVGS